MIGDLEKYFEEKKLSNGKSFNLNAKKFYYTQEGDYDTKDQKKRREFRDIFNDMSNDVDSVSKLQITMIKHV